MLRRVSRESLDEPARSSTVLGDWYANLLFTRRARLVLLVSDRSLLSVLFPVRDCVNFVPRFRSAVTDLLTSLGIAPVALATELREMNEVQFGRTISRSVLGSMNDLAYHARWLLGERPSLRETDLALELSQIPCGPIGYRHPGEVAAELLAQTAVAWRAPAAPDTDCSAEKIEHTE